MDEIAHASVSIDAPVERVWNALVDPAAIREYMFGAEAVSEWREGDPIAWKGVWKGKAYEDKGKILELRPEERLRYTHFSPLSGLPDEPGSYHTVTIDLAPEGDRTMLDLEQDNNRTAESRQHSEAQWGQMLAGLKAYVER